MADAFHGPAHRVSAVVLAAGRSTRMGPSNKLLLPLKGRPLIRWAVEAAVASAPGEILVVLGHAGPRIRAAVEGLAVRFVENPGFSEGLASSLVAGVREASEESAGYAVLLGDMPLILPATIRRLCDLMAAGAGTSILAPVFQGRRGHPVVFGRLYRDELLALQGDAGAKAVVQRHPEALIEAPVEDPGVVEDVDDLQTYRRVGGVP